MTSKNSIAGNPPSADITDAKPSPVRDDPSTAGLLNTFNIKPRRFRIDYESQTQADVANKWVSGDAFLTHWMNAYTIIIPEGEKFIVRTVKPFIEQIKSAELKSQVSGLVAQELSHSKAHAKFSAVIERQGFNTKLFSSIYKFFSYKIMEPLSPPLMCLAIVVAIERINELIAEITLQSKVLDSAPEHVATLYKWHFAEEIEHKSVAYDLYHEISGNKWLLGYGTFLCYLTNCVFLCLGALQFSIQDASILNPKTWLRGLRYFFTKEKFLWRITKGCYQLIKADFHPSYSNNLYLAEPILVGRDIGAEQALGTPQQGTLRSVN